MTIQSFLQNLTNGISLGALYALISIGYTMVYGILRLINFAHGDLIMLGAYIAFYGVALFMLPWWLAFPLAILLTTLTGIVIEKAAYKPLREFPRINLFAAAVAVAFLLENLAIVVFGGRPKAFAALYFLISSSTSEVFLLSATRRSLSSRQSFYALFSSSSSTAPKLA